MIAQMGTVYSIDIPTMRKIVAQSVNIDEGTIDMEALRKRCIAVRSKGAENNPDDYDVTPVQYLYNLKGQQEVEPWEKKLLEEISMEYHLSREVTNYLLRYVYENHDKRITSNLTKAVARDWSVHNITTVEQAQEYVNSLSKKSSRSSKVPDFTIKKTPKEKVSIDEIRSRIFQEERE